MPFITQGKTNWKFLLIVIILATIVGGGSLWYSIKEKNRITCVNNCGNGICEEVVCMAIGCPCFETKENCPQDCKAKIEDETVNWKTCTNEEYGFEINYPNEWVKDESTLFPDYMKEAVGSALSCTFFIPKTKRIPEDVWISVSTRSCKSLSCDPREEIEEPYRKGIKQSIIKGRSVFIFDDAFEGVRNLSYILVDESKTRQGWLTLAIHHGRQTGTEYLLDEEIEPELKIFQQMLSTFRFLKVGVSLDQLKNATYEVRDMVTMHGTEMVSLKNAVGKNDMDGMMATLKDQNVVFGDLNNDGLNDAVVLLDVTKEGSTEKDLEVVLDISGPIKTFLCDEVSSEGTMSYTIENGLVINSYKNAVFPGGDHLRQVFKFDGKECVVGDIDITTGKVNF